MGFSECIVTSISHSFLSCCLMYLFVLLVVEREVGRVDTFVRVVECKRLCASNAMLFLVVAKYSVLQCDAVHCSALQCVAVRCSALQCVAVRCSALQCDCCSV